MTVGVATEQMIKVARSVAVQSGLSEETGVAKATEGILEATQTLGNEVVSQVKKALPPDISGGAAE